MAIANLHETLLAYTLRKSELQYEIGCLSDQKMLATYTVGDLQSSLAHEKRKIGEQYKAIWNEEYSDKTVYIDYTKMPDYQEAIDRITAEFQEKIDEQTAWESLLDNQITTDSTELEEINAWLDSYKQMESANIQEDFNYGMNS